VPASKRCFLTGMLVAVTALALDLLSKWVMLAKVLVPPDHMVIEVTSFFNLALVWNYGISFGIFAAQRQPVLLIIMSAAIISVLLVWLYKNKSLLVAYALGLVIGGAVGNVIDRLRFEAVVDFLDFHIGSYHWPAFNIADSCIFIGVVLLCVSSMVMEHHHKP
jgi:signal peptidase II